MAHQAAWKAAVKTATTAGPLLPRRIRLPGALGGWTDSRTLPAIPKESFRGWWKRTQGDTK